MDKEHIAELEEKSKRYNRLLNNEDFTKTLDDIDDAFGLNQNVFGVLKAGLTTDFVVAKEGARAFSVRLRGLEKEIEIALEDAKNGDEDE